MKQEEERGVGEIIGEGQQDANRDTQREGE